jgi:CRP-like cAMP-binding protein
MIDKLINKIENDKQNREMFGDIFIERKIESKTVLLNAGDIASYVYFVKKGCLREWFNKDGKEITFQFFIEGQSVSSIDSFINGKPSLFSIESIEPSIIITARKADIERFFGVYPELKENFQRFIFERFSNYARLFLSRITDTPQERYEDLLRNHSEIIQRIPQHYIASFLGITPVSLSRIRNRKQI